MKIVLALLSLLLGMSAVVLPAHSGETRLIDPSGYFKDLPGVTAPDASRKEPEYRCTTATAVP